MPEPKFAPKPGQVDYTNIRYAPVINCVVTRADGKVLLVQRSANMRLYPGFWNGVSGFLDDSKSIEEKVQEELREEIGITAKDIIRIERGQVILQEAPDYGKTWLVVPILVTVRAAEVQTDWEAEAARWFDPSEVPSLKLLPGFAGVFGQFFEYSNHEEAIMPNPTR